MMTQYRYKHIAHIVKEADEWLNGQWPSPNPAPLSPMSSHEYIVELYKEVTRLRKKGE